MVFKRGGGNFTLCGFAFDFGEDIAILVTFTDLVYFYHRLVG